MATKCQCRFVNIAEKWWKNLVSKKTFSTVILFLITVCFKVILCLSNAFYPIMLLTSKLCFVCVHKLVEIRTYISWINCAFQCFLSRLKILSKNLRNDWKCDVLLTSKSVNVSAQCISGYPENQWRQTNV